MCKITSFSEPFIVGPINRYFFPEGIKRVKDTNLNKLNQRSIVELHVMQISAIAGATLVASFGLFCHVMKWFNHSMTWTTCLILCTLLGYIIGALIAAKSLQCCCMVKDPINI